MNSLAFARVDLPRKGGNNRLSCIQAGAGRVAEKRYDASSADGLERLEREACALEFLGTLGVRNVPQLVSVDRENRVLCMEWIEGGPADSITDEDISTALSLAATLHAARTNAGAHRLPLAREACLSLEALCEQVRARLTRLRAAGEGDLELLLDRAARAFARAESDARSAPLRETLSHEEATLSPSDFGFHNALRTADGRLTFIDFEYFGWDDPVKLTADFLLHPGMALSPEQKRAFARGAETIYGGDAQFRARLVAHFDLYALRWAAIVLNEFLPEGRARRTFAGGERDWEATKHTQLAKAQRLLDELESGAVHESLADG